MAKRFALALLVLSILGVAAAYASAFAPPAPGWAAWVMAFSVAGVLVAMAILGAARKGRIGRLKIPLALLFAIVAGGFALVLAMPPEAPGDPRLWLGLPPRAAIVIYGIGLLPLLIIPVAYALTFDEFTLSAGDLERVRREARAIHAGVVESEGERGAA